MPGELLTGSSSIAGSIDIAGRTPRPAGTVRTALASALLAVLIAVVPAAAAHAAGPVVPRNSAAYDGQDGSRDLTGQTAQGSAGGNSSTANGEDDTTPPAPFSGDGDSDQPEPEDPGNGVVTTPAPQDDSEADPATPAEQTPTPEPAEETVEPSPSASAAATSSPVPSHGYAAHASEGYDMGRPGGYEDAPLDPENGAEESPSAAIVAVEQSPPHTISGLLAFTGAGAAIVLAALTLLPIGLLMLWHSRTSERSLFRRL